jgi:hypothetical protein
MYIEEKRGITKTKNIHRKEVSTPVQCMSALAAHLSIRANLPLPMNDHDDQDDFTYPAIVAWSRTHTLHPAALLLR